MSELPVVPFHRPRVMDPSPELFELRGRVIEVRIGADGPTGFLVSGFDDVRAGLLDPRLLAAGSAGPRAVEYGVPAVFTQPGNMLGMDGPEHARLRRAISPAFTGRRMERLRPRVQATVDRMLDGIAAAGPPADVHELLSLPLPMQVSTELLGVPWEDRDRFVSWSGDLLMAHGGDQTTAQAAWGNIAGYLGKLLVERRDAPAEDFLSDLAGMVREEVISEQEATMLAAGTLVAGYETTTVEIEYGIVALMRHPEQWRALRADPGLAAGVAEEVFRLHPPGVGTIGHQRWAATDLEIGGVRIPEGAFVLLCFAAAAVDPEHVGPHPQRFDVTRRSNPHMTFGYGPHHCVGASLARLELEVLFATLPGRFPDLALAVPEEELPVRAHVMTGGFAALPVTF